jgi:hypothetical protein
MLTATLHLKHPRELLMRLLLRLPIVLADDQDAQMLEYGLQVGVVVQELGVAAWIREQELLDWGLNRIISDGISSKCLPRQG